MKKMSGSEYSLIVIMVIMLAVIVSSLGMPTFFSKLLPLTIGIIVFLLSAIKLRQEFLSRDRTKATVTEDDVSEIPESKGTRRAYLLTFAWIPGLVLAIYLLGFLISIPVFVLSFMKTHGTRWRTAIISAVITLAVVYFGFQRLLEIWFYEGLLFIWLDRILP